MHNIFKLIPLIKLSLAGFAFSSPLTVKDSNLFLNVNLLLYSQEAPFLICLLSFRLIRWDLVWLVFLSLIIYFSVQLFSHRFNYYGHFTYSSHLSSGYSFFCSPTSCDLLTFKCRLYSMQANNLNLDSALPKSCGLCPLPFIE